MNKKKLDIADEIAGLLKQPAQVDEEAWDAEVTQLEQDPRVQSLTYKQKLFAIHYCQGLTGTNAVIAAGYSKNGAHVMANTLLKHEGVQLLILRRQQALANASRINREYVMQELAELIEEQRMSHNPDRNLQLKILEMICKLNGLYTPDVQLNLQNNAESIKIEIVKPNADEPDQH